MTGLGESFLADLLDRFDCSVNASISLFGVYGSLEIDVKNPLGSIRCMPARKKTARSHKRRDLTTPLQLAGHSDSVILLELSLDGTALFSSDSSGVVRSWDLRRPPRRSTVCRGVHSGPITSILLLPRRVLTTSAGEPQVVVWDSKGKTCTRVVQFTAPINTSFATQSESFDYVCSPDSDGSVWLWDFKQLEAACEVDLVRQCVQLDGDSVLCGCATRHKVFVGSESGQIVGLDVLMDSVQRYSGTAGKRVEGIAVTSVDDFLYAVTDDGCMLCWAVSDGTLIGKCELPGTPQTVFTHQNLISSGHIIHCKQRLLNNALPLLLSVRRWSDQS